MTRKTLSNLLASLGLIIAFTASFGGALFYDHVMTVHIKGLRSAEGVVHVLVYDNTQAFEEGSLTDLVTYKTQRIESDEMVITLPGVRPGTYAVSIHHDENGNNEFDVFGLNLLEGWGYSNNVGQTDTPDFAAASFAFDERQLPQIIDVIYLN